MSNHSDFKKNIIDNARQKELKLRDYHNKVFASSSEKALDMILDYPFPAKLIQSFPDQDLYYLMHKIGKSDFIPVLSMASSEQWEYILDMDVWDNDRLDIKSMTNSFDLLFKADSQRLLRWVIKEKPDFLEFYLLNNIDIKIREHDELIPDDSDEYITFDDKFYFKIKALVNEEDKENNRELILKMFKTLAELDLSVLHGLLLETSALMLSQTEEEQYRQKNIRLAEKGFLPFHHAIGIYQPTSSSFISKRQDKTFLDKEYFDSDLPLPPQFFSNVFQNKNLFVKALNLFDNKALLFFETEFAVLTNKIISADKIKVESIKMLEKAALKACDYLNLGIEKMLNGRLDIVLARDIIANYSLEDIFRAGVQESIFLKIRAQKWFKKSFMYKKRLPLSFLCEDFLAVLGGLFLDRPLLFVKDAEVLDTKEIKTKLEISDSGAMYKNFQSVFEIEQASKTLDKIIAIDEMLDKADFDISSFTQGILTYKSLILTLWAKRCLNLELSLEPIDIKVFKKFFIQLFSSFDNSSYDSSNKDKSKGKETIQLSDMISWISEISGIENISKNLIMVLENLLEEIKDEYASLDENDIDPRFMPHFFLK